MTMSPDPRSDEFRCLCVRPTADLPEKRDHYVEFVKGLWAYDKCLCKGVGIVVRSEYRDVRCVCVRERVEIAPDDRARYVPISGFAGSYARTDCLCKGDGTDPRVFMLWELVDGGAWIIDHLNRRVGDLERHILRLNARLAGKPEPPVDAEYQHDVDGP